MIYVCSEEDEKAKLSHDIFDRWYRKSGLQETIVKIDNIININIGKFEIQKLYTSFMFHRDNTNYKKLIEIYRQIEKILNAEK